MAGGNAASSSPRRTAAEPPVAAVTASATPIGAFGPIKAAATASNAIQLNALAAANMDSATPCVRRGEGLWPCGCSDRITSCPQPPYTHRSASSSTGSGGLALEQCAGEGADSVEEEEEGDVVMDELDLYCSNSAFLYQSPANSIAWSSATAGLCETSAKAVVPHCDQRAVGACSTRGSTSSASSFSSTVSRKPRQRGAPVSELEYRGEEEPAGGQDDVEGSGEADDCRVAEAPAHLQTATFAGLSNADDAELGFNFAESRAAAPIVGSRHENNAGGGMRDSSAEQVRASAEVKAKRCDGRDHCWSNASAGACLSSAAPSWPAAESAFSSSSARRQCRSGGSGNGRSGGEHGAGEVAATLLGVAAKPTSDATVDTQASPAPPLRSSAAVAPAALPPAAEAKDPSYVPPLMDEFDGELLQLIKAYYLRKQSMTAAAAPRYPAPKAAAEGGRRGGDSDAPDSRPPLLSADDRRDAPSLLRGPVAASHTAAAAAELSEGSARGPRELRVRCSGDRPSSHVIVSSDGAPFASAAAAGLWLGEGVTNLSPCMGMNRFGVHGDGSHVGYGAATAPATAASSFDVQQHTSLSAAALYDSAAFDEPSRVQQRVAAVRETATIADGAASLHRLAHGFASSGGAGGALGSGIASSLSALSSLPSYSSTSFVRAYVSDISLSLEPAIIVSALTAALNIVVVYFLQQHVLDTRDHLGLFLIGSYMVFSSYYMIYYFLERFSDSFRRIASQDKKFYIIGNLIKAGILISITPFACVHLVKIIVFEEWESNILRNLGCIYAIPDFISMVVVRRMRWSTWVHHACVVLFNYFSIMNNYQHENVCRCVVVYAAFSSFAYCVNVLLASRFLGVSANVARVLSFVALVVYALCCAVNWAWQVYYLRRLLISGHDHWTVYTYMFLISLVMWDDIVLNKWLLHHARNNAYAASQHLQQHRIRQQHQSPPASSLITPARLSQRPSPLYRGQGTRAIHTAPPPLPTGLPPRAP
ncbi:hypothetical protein LSCM4_08245 [Leishmania orientalis]|uniref:Uncharacterized protein n=1 Tax=Leishmania orientalis TaxID=2249476 RepID=A0A836I0W7_9TRYP|nr:hypothetical protein LSCM4_08245 [Leishmania orientalis]